MQRAASEGLRGFGSQYLIFKSKMPATIKEEEEEIIFC